MPELPEVETVVRQLRAGLVGRRFTAFASHWPRQCSPGPREVEAGIVGRSCVALERRAKYIVARLDDGAALLIHLRMSGRLAWAGDGEPPRHVRAEFQLDRGRLLFDDARKFGRVVYAADAAVATAALGAEPLAPGFTAARLARLLAGRERQIKPLLLDQAVVAGLGNIYVDEALFAAGIHPTTPANRLDRAAVGRLHRAIRAVLRAGIRHNGTSFDWIYPEGRMQQHLRVYGRAGESCLACGTPIERLRIGQRGTHVCPRCQPIEAVEARPAGERSGRRERSADRRAAAGRGPLA